MNVSFLPAKQDILPGKKRVAAYARVSGGKDASLHSLSAQIAFYSGLIQRNNEWEYAGVYADEAEIVRYIFNSYLSGMGLNLIVKELIKRKAPTKNNGEWRENVLKRILQNEKYVVALLLQKTFVVDHISKRTAVNKGELPQYYVENNHPSIIDRDTFQKVQDEMKRRAEKYLCTPAQKQTYEFTSKIKCEQCGKNYRRKVLSSGKVVWICSTFNRLGKAYCPSQQIPEDILKRVVGDTEFCEIHIPCRNTINIIQNDGTVITKHWENPSRKDSWTPQMRELARERSKNG